MIKSRVKIKKDGISTFIATLLLMVLAVSAGVVIYAYTMGYLGNFNLMGGNPTLQVQSTAEVGGYFTSTPRTLVAER